MNTEVRPAERVKDHIFGCFIADKAGVEMRALAGIDNLMFEGDYPHSDSNFPNSRKNLAVVLQDVPDDEARKIAEGNARRVFRSEEHTSELQSLMRLSYAVFCLKKKQHIQTV